MIWRDNEDITKAAMATLHSTIKELRKPRQKQEVRLMKKTKTLLGQFKAKMMPMKMEPIS